MGWEVVREKRIPCICGKGSIIQKEYGDDWNRFKDGPVEIECIDCSKRYRVDSISQGGLLKTDGVWTSYYLVPKDYPEYDGITVSKIYPKYNSSDDLPFEEYLIREYSLNSLEAVRDDMTYNMALSRIGRCARKICESHKRTLKTASVKIVLSKVNQAILEYPSVEESYDRRREVEIQEKEERKLYDIEKKKHAIPLNL